ncbi:MAG: MFS transporter [Anaerolineae bacterium]
MRNIEAGRVYLVSSLVAGAAYSTVFTLSQIYRIVTVELDPLQLVLVGTVLEATIFVFEIPTGVVADVYSRRLSTIIGTALTGLAFLVEGTFPVFGAILLGEVLWGLGYTFISGAEDAWIADEVGPDRVGPLYLRSTQLFEIGALTAIPLSVALGQLSLNLPFQVGGAIFLGLAGFLWLFMSEEGFTPVPRGERRTWKVFTGTMGQGLRLARTRRVLLWLLVAATFVGLYSEGYDRLREAHLLAEISFPAFAGLSVVAWFGILELGRRLLTLASTELVRRRVDTQDEARLTRALQGIYGLVSAAILIFTLTDRFAVAFAAAWLIGALRVTAGPLYLAWINRHTDSAVRATVISMWGQVDALGQIIGGPFVGAIGTLRSIRAALIASAILLSPALPLFGLAGRASQDSDDPAN